MASASQRDDGSRSAHSGWRIAFMLLLLYPSENRKYMVLWGTYRKNGLSLCRSRKSSYFSVIATTL